MKSGNFLTILKGLIIGGTMLVPGVSGGSMAMTLGIYNELISTISNIRHWKKKDIIFLSLFILGAAAGMLIFANPILLLIEKYPKPTIFFFLGAVSGAVPMIYRQSQVTKISVRQIIYILIGAALVLAISLLPQELIHTSSDNRILWSIVLVTVGFVSAVALILPGISFSYFLLILGLYDDTMSAISDINITFLFFLLLGLAVGILVFTKLLDRAMKIYPHAAYLIILGFVIGSIIDAFPGIPFGWEWLICILTASTGFTAIFLMSKE